MALYAVGVLGVLIDAWVGFAIYTIVAMIWIIPDRRIVRGMAAGEHRVPPPPM